MQNQLRTIRRCRFTKQKFQCELEGKSSFKVARRKKSLNENKTITNSKEPLPLPSKVSNRIFTLDGIGVTSTQAHVWMGDMHGGGACLAGETATVADGTHPTGMHSCMKN